MKQLLFIVNPCSGQKKAKKHLLEIVDIFNRAGFTVLTHITAGPGDGTAAVLRYAGLVDRVVCCGGDGTFHETVAGVLQSGLDLPIGYIPAGSTNDFAASLGLSSDILQAARDAAEGTPHPVDVGQFGERYFSYVASFGAFTRASYATPQSAKNVLGHAAYMLGGIQELSQLRPWPVEVTLAEGGVYTGEYLFGAVSNATSMGGVLTLDRERVSMDDGLLELMLIRTPKDLTELRDCVLALQQKTYHCAMLTFVSSRQITVSAPAEMDWTLDGEHQPGAESITIRCLPQAIRVFQRED